MRILIVGAGALGGYFGARLLAAGRDVTFLVRPRRAQQLAEDGLQVISPFGNITLASPPTVLAEQLQDSFDLILLSCKAYDLAGAMDAFASAVADESAILPLLNGMAHMETLDQRFGRKHVLGGSTNLSAVLDEGGRIRQLNRLDSLMLGDRDQPEADRVRTIAETLAVPGYVASMRPTILDDMWQKWVTIATAAGMTCLMRAAIGDIVAAGAAPLVQQLLLECASIAGREGFPPPARHQEVTLAKFTEPGSLFTASTLRDLESGGQIEAKQILGDLLELGEKHGLQTPLLRVAHAHMRCYEERRERELNA